MTRVRPSASARLAALAALGAGLAVAWWHLRTPPPSLPATAPSGGIASSTDAALAEALPHRHGAPVIELDADGALLKVSHKDAKGQIPLATVETPEGTVTIRRTFDGSGRLINEQAYRGQQPVPMPPAR